MQMNNMSSFNLYFESGCVRGNLVDAASLMPDGPNAPSRRVVVGVNSGTSKAPRSLLKLGFDAQ